MTRDFSQEQWRTWRKAFYSGRQSACTITTEATRGSYAVRSGAASAQVHEDNSG
ncbi:MAG TPA: hypothetical protein VI636_17780 [Candidatus Angelobacter sp.]